MKKALLGLFGIAAIFSTGCLGNTAEAVLGDWQMVQVSDPAVVHPMQWSFRDNGECFFYDYTLGTFVDTGSYECYMNGTHKILKIKGTTAGDPYLKFNGEWYIVQPVDDKLVIGTKDQGGFQQREFTR